MKRRIIIFSGAGISQPSGISTFRDSDGLWENHKIDEICNYKTWFRNHDKVHRFYNERRTQLGTVKPNIAHETIAKWQEQFGVENVINITQNVDDLFERAGVKETIHVHGHLDRMKCESCGTEWKIGYEDFDYKNPVCPCEDCDTHKKIKLINETERKVECQSCGKKFTMDDFDTLEDCECINKKCDSRKAIKPAIIFFGEYPDYHASKRFLDSLGTEDILIVIGTMGNVFDISRHIEFVLYSNRQKPTMILNNMEKSISISDRYFREDKGHIFYESCTTAIKKIDEIVQTTMGTK